MPDESYVLPLALWLTPNYLCRFDQFTIQVINTILIKFKLLSCLISFLELKWLFVSVPSTKGKASLATRSIIDVLLFPCGRGPSNLLFIPRDVSPRVFVLLVCVVFIYSTEHGRSHAGHCGWGVCLTGKSILPPQLNRVAEVWTVVRL